MEYDQKQFIDLLQKHTSDETKKARRNVSAIAFAIIASWLLGVRLADVRFLGIDLSKTSELWLLTLAGVLLAYWITMFLASWKHDAEIQKERTWFLNSEVTRLRARLAHIEAEEKKRPGHGAMMDKGHVTEFLNLYDAQRRRTEQASALGGFIRELEFYVPLTLSAAALMVLLLAAFFRPG